MLAMKKRRTDNGKKKATSFYLVTAGSILVLAQIAIIFVVWNRVNSAVWQKGEPSDMSGLLQRLDKFAPVETRKRRPRRRKDSPNGFFNGYPIWYNDGSTPQHSAVSCLGENYMANAWIHRSCKFRNLCFDISAEEWILYQSKEEQEMENLTVSLGFHDVSSSMNTTVSIGGVNTKWTWSRGIPRMEWFPKVVAGDLIEPHYELDASVVWLPFHSLAAFNPGHLIWDDFLPLFTLMTIFFDEVDSYELLMTRYILPGPERLWASCDVRDDQTNLCNLMFTKFLPLMGLRYNEGFSTNRDVNVTFSKEGKGTNLVCARNGAAGIGMLTDHGYKLHGWEKADYERMHNQGRGRTFWEFRKFMMANVGFTQDEIVGPPYKLTISESSSKSYKRKFGFAKQIDAIKSAFGDVIEIEKVKLKDLAANQQVRLLAQTTFFVTACGGGAVSSIFLPRHAVVLLYYPKEGGIQNNRETKLPARLDWDLFNNLGYIKPHWLPTESMNNDVDIDMLIRLMKHELDLLSHRLER